MLHHPVPAGESDLGMSAGVAAVHVADVPLRALGSMWRLPASVRVPGLRRLDAGVCAPLSSGPFSPQLRRWMVFSCWDDQESLDHFEATHPLAKRFADGWHAHLEPLRMHGSWPGMDEGLPRSRVTEHTGRSVVVTLGRLRLSQAVRFFRASIPAARAADATPGLVWATGAARPPHFFATLSVWESTEALSRYAYGSDPPAHTGAIHAGRSKPFHHREAFIRFRPTRERGQLLRGRNPFVAASRDAVLDAGEHGRGASGHGGMA